MAIWHFELNLIPEDGIKKVHGVIPHELPEYRAMTVETNLEEIPLNNYWSGVDVFRCVVPYAEVIFPEIFYRSKDEIKLGARDGNRLTLALDEVLFQFDLRDPDLEILEEVLRLARRFGCKLAVDKKGVLVDPEMLPVLELVMESTAFKFVKDPIGCLAKLGSRMKQ